MRRTVVSLALVALALTGCQSNPDDSADGTGDVSLSDSTSIPTPSASPSSTPAPSTVISPDLHTTTKCTVAPGKYPTMNKGVRFTAESTVVNRGNIGATIQLKATWNGTTTVHRAETISVGYGKKAKVTFNAPTNKSGVAAFHANGPDRCDVTVKVLSILGKARPAK